MSFSTILFTEKGRALQSKALAGATLQLTKLAMGSGSLGGQSQVVLNALIEPKVTLPITSIKRNSNHVVLEGNFSNGDVATGFYWREIGVYAADPDIGEILYCYGNAGTLAEYIPPQTSEIIEKVVGVSAMVGDAANVTAVMDESLMFVTKPELDEVREKAGQAYDLASREKTASEIKFVNTISTADIDNVQDAITTMVTETKAGLELIKTKADNAQNKADQAFTQASNGKEAIKTAITGKDPSVTIPTDATFAQLAQAIGQIETGVNTDDATATAEQILAGMTAYVKGMKVIGTMANRGAVNQSLGVNGSYTIPQGYHNGQGKVSQSIPTKAAQTYTPGINNQIIAANQYLTGAQTILGDANLISANILQGKSIFDVAGSAVQGKRWASGVSAVSSTAGSFHYIQPHPNSGSTSFTAGFVTVTNLNFKPSYIFVTVQSNATDQRITVYDTLTNRFYPETFIMLLANSSYIAGTYTYCLKADTGSAYVNETGFQAPLAASPGKEARWIAFE